MKDKICEWYEPDWVEEDFYETQCKGAFCFEEGDLTDHNYNYCPKCGKKIKVIKHEEDKE